MFFAAVEGGGQSWVCAISSGEPENIIEKKIFLTESPEVTLGSIRKWLNEKKFNSIGIASFGPIDARPDSNKFGYITSTPKEGWKDTNVLKMLGIYEEFKNIPYLFDTDVNAPALSEYVALSKLNKSLTSCAYITLGTGVGVGLVINGKTVHGALHPEAGHICSARYKDDHFSGVCKFHGACIEGMCSSVAVAARAGVNLTDLPTLSDDHPVWDICAFYIASLCTNILLMTSAEKIVLGGGLMNRTCLYAKIHAHTIAILNNYIEIHQVNGDNIKEYIVPSRWANSAGIVGAAYLAKIANEQQLK